MPSFDFITNKEFRQSLEADHSEMQSCVEVGAWKSAQVAAGSIVEALLIDHLMVSPNPGRKEKNLLALDLAKAVDICLDEQILSRRTADLCSVIRSYRNLIHPGRQIRLKEPPPNKESAVIAQSVIELIVGELAKVRREKVGLTGEQVVSKLKRDGQSLTILKHLMLEVDESNQERLLLELIPQEYLQQSDDDDAFGVVRTRLSSAFRTILEGASEATRRKTAAEFVRILREDDGNLVDSYCSAFFLATDLAYVAEASKAMVTGYLLGRDTPATTASLKTIERINAFLGPEDAAKWVDILMLAYTGGTAPALVKEDARKQLVLAQWGTTKEFDEAVLARFKDWKDHFVKFQAPQKAQLITQIEAEMIPL